MVWFKFVRDRLAKPTGVTTGPTPRNPQKELSSATILWYRKACHNPSVWKEDEGGSRLTNDTIPKLAV